MIEEPQSYDTFNNMIFRLIVGL